MIEVQAQIDDEELFDLVSGCEALSAKRTGAGPSRASGPE
jgi:hypothetical protein